LIGARTRIQEEGKLKRNHVLLVALLLLALILVPAVTACGGEEETTTTAGSTETTAAPDDPAAIADAAIAAVTKSDKIETPKTLKAGKLQAGSDTAFAPMEFSDEKGGYIGFDVDLCTALAKKMGLELVVIPTAWDGIIPGLLGNRFDIIMSAMSILPERLEQINFTDGYLLNNLAITTKADAPIADEQGLVGKIVGVQVDTTGQFAVEEIAGVKEIKKYGTIVEAIQDLLAGRVDAVVNDSPVNQYYIKDKPEFANTGKVGSDEWYGFGINKENTDLLAAMNAALGELKAEGVYDKIHAKWLGG
jgi:ABC-type amino acid transport substrate-binding protein